LDEWTLLVQVLEWVERYILVPLGLVDVFFLAGVFVIVLFRVSFVQALISHVFELLADGTLAVLGRTYCSSDHHSSPSFKVTPWIWTGRLRLHRSAVRGRCGALWRRRVNFTTLVETLDKAISTCVGVYAEVLETAAAQCQSLFNHCDTVALSHKFV